MDPSKPEAGEFWPRLASGIEAGTVGGLAMLGLLISGSLWDGHVWWEVPNLLGSTFYGPRAFRSGPSMATLSGVALHFVITGTLGGLFGLACGGIHQRGRLILLGVLASVGWYNLANFTFWPRVNPWVPVVSPRPATVFSHLLLGACLGYMGLRQKPPPREPAFVLRTELSPEQTAPDPSLPDGRGLPQAVEPPAEAPTDALE